MPSYRTRGPKQVPNASRLLGTTEGIGCWTDVQKMMMDGDGDDGDGDDGDGRDKGDGE